MTQVNGGKNVAKAVCNCYHKQIYNYFFILYFYHSDCYAIDTYFYRFYLNCTISKKIDLDSNEQVQ